MRFIHGLLNQMRQTAKEDAAQNIEEERQRRAAQRAHHAASEVEAAGPWSRSAWFESGSVNVVAVIFTSAYGYRGQQIQVDIRADGTMKGQLIEAGSPPEITQFSVSPQQKTPLLRSLLRSVEDNKFEPNPGKSAVQNFLAQARHAAVHEFVLDQLNRSLTPSDGPNIS